MRLRHLFFIAFSALPAATKAIYERTHHIPLIDRSEFRCVFTTKNAKIVDPREYDILKFTVFVLFPAVRFRENEDSPTTLFEEKIILWEDENSTIIHNRTTSAEGPRRVNVQFTKDLHWAEQMENSKFSPIVETRLTNEKTKEVVFSQYNTVDCSFGDYSFRTKHVDNVNAPAVFLVVIFAIGVLGVYSRMILGKCDLEEQKENNQPPARPTVRTERVIEREDFDFSDRSTVCSYLS